MKLRWGTILLGIAASLSGGAQQLAVQNGLTRQQTPYTSCGSAGATGTVTLRAPEKNSSPLSLCDGRALGAATSRAAQARPLALASGDFDQDGVPDLVSGYGEASGGLITVHRGNVYALWPYAVDLRNGPPAAFLPKARTFSVPEAPDFIATGDFDADGHWDVVTAHRGSNTMYLLRGDGRGGFLPAKPYTVNGSITAMTSGEINRRDGLIDLIVGVSTDGGSRVLVYESPTGALSTQPEMFAFSQPITSLALGKFDGGAMNDLAIAAGNQLAVIHARDRKLSLGAVAQSTVQRAKVTVQQLSFSINALVAGDFTGKGPTIAALDEGGKIHILEHAVSQTTLLGGALQSNEAAPSFQLSKSGKDGKAIVVGGSLAPGTRAGLDAMRASLRSNLNATEWTERNTIALPSGFSQIVPHLVAGRVSSSRGEDLLIPDTGNGQVHILSAISSTRGRVSALTSNSAPRESMRLIASLKASSAPAAVLPMRLSKHGLSGLVTLQAGHGEPTLMPQDVPPANVFTVTNTLDITQVGGTVPAGSLRHAMDDVQNASGENGGGNFEIAFNIPTSDPGYNAATGTFLIQPLSQSVPGALNNFALPPINATVSIDGYTQPGASPNTLATGDNAKLLIQIDGGKATTPGGSGFVPFDDVGSTFRGIVFTGWTNPAISTGSSGSTASGAEGIEANGVGDFIEGNFFGTDVTGKIAAPNRIGIFADNGPLFGSAPGNIIGGTTPQARNIISANNNSGVLFLSTAFEAQLQGNFIGLDITGNKIVSNPQEAGRSNTFDGAGLNGPTVTIGGTLPGSGNVIAGNGTNIDINDLTEGGAASGSLVVGNFIGTDASGTHAIANQGYGVSILHNPTNMTIGGTTPAARNVISGNLAGVYIFDNAFNNVVQGNYIGTDATGSKAVPNVQQGFVTGATGTDERPAGYTTIGGSSLGAGNVISGNTTDGISITGTSQSSGGPFVGNTIVGNFIGTDATGTRALANGGSGINLGAAATNNLIGSSTPGSSNVIAFNAGDGILIDPGTPSGGQGLSNNTIANVILSNKGTGVRVKSGANNRISQNVIFTNGALGIDLDTAGPNLNSSCNAANTGGNNLQNAPVLTGGSGSQYVTATATDPNGNTSEFSNAVKSSGSGNILDLLGNFNSAANTKYTIEFFSSTTPDPSGFGQGETFLGSTSVTTDGSCAVSVNDPVDLTKADVSVTLTSDTTQFNVGADFGQFYYTGSVANNGAATAHNVVFTDVLPTGLQISSAYCNVASCQTPVLTSLGSCTVTGKTLTCNLGTMAPGATATITIPVQATSPGSIVNVATVKATEPDPIPANNTSSQTENVYYPYPFVDHVDPTSALTKTSGTLPLTVYGNGFVPTSAVTFNGTAVTTTGYLDNQICGGPFSPGFCSAIQVSVPASLLGTAGTATVTVTNPDPGPGGSGNEPSSASFTLVSACTYDPEFFGFNPVDAEGDTLIPESVEVSTNAPTCAWSAKSNDSWLVILDHANGTGNGSFDVAVAPNTGAARSGTLTVAGKTVEIDQSAGDSTICSYALNPASARLAATGASGTFAVTTGSQCAYFVEAFPEDSESFITIPKTSGLLVGNGSPAYTVAANHGAPRAGAIMVGGDVFQIAQDGPPCYFTLNSSSALIPATGGSGTIAIKASSASCAWTAKPSNVSQVVISSGASGTGNGTVKYTVPANLGGPAKPTITIGDASGYSVFTVNQASAFTCTFTVTPTPRSVGTNGTTDFFTITASYSECKWTATSNNPDALSITGATSGTGTKAVFYAVGQNNGSARTLTITAGCQTFTVNQDGQGATNPVPAITSVLPASAAAGSGALTLTVNGTGFLNGSVVRFNGTARATTYLSATKLTAAILASDLASAGTAPVTVTNPAPGGGISNAVNFTITVANNPLPTLTTLQPATTSAGSAAFTLTVNGTGFVSNSVVSFKGAARATTFVSATKLTASILASDVATAGTASVTVTNPTPGGGTSNAVNFTITAANNPLPTLTTLQPANTAAGSAAFALTVNGTGFVSNSVVNFKGTARATTFASATRLTASILASDVATAGTAPVTVTNPTPGGGTSNAVNFTITAANNPIPSLTTLQPSTIVAGSSAFTVTLNGSGFVSTSVVSFQGAARATTFVSATKLTAAILASDVATAGTASVTVTNPTPGGGTSNALSFTITASTNPVPVATSLQPTSVPAESGAFSLTVNGSGFVGTSVVNFNGSARATIYVSATQLIASILDGDVTNTGTASITVKNPAPGGGTSNVLNFTITPPANPLPVISTLQPANTLAGSSALTVTVNGTGYVASSVAKLNGAARVTTFISAKQLTVAVLVSDMTTAGTRSITVSSPAPGGGTSNAAVFTVSNPLPSITTLQPQTIVAGSAAFDLIVNGSGFNASSVVMFNGKARTTTLVSATQLSAAITTADLVATASVPVVVTNPAPGGGSSTSMPFTITAAPAPVAVLNPTSITFPSTVAGAVTDAKNVTLSNTGTASLAISGISITGTNPTDFNQTNTCGASLDVGASCTISITFKPASVASFAATLSVADSAAGSPQVVALAGAGLAAPSFTLSAPATAQTVVAGGSAQFTISVNAENGTFANAVTLSATGLPAGATATFSPASVTPGSSSANSQLTIQTAAPTATTASAKDAHLTWPFAAGALPLFGLLFAGKRRRRWIAMALLLFASIGAVATLTGCGGGFGSPNTGTTYNVTVTGTSGTDKQTTTVQLIVK